VESTLRQIISDRIDIKTNPENPHYPLHKAVLTPGQRTPVPTEIRQLHWLKYPENDVFINPDLFEDYNY
jgi:hypothetical protein